jgi:hypothetical protein
MEGVHWIEVLDFIVLVQMRKSFKALHPHTGCDHDHAGFNGRIVREHKTLRALAVRTENSLWSIVLLMVAEYVNPACEKRGRDHFAFISLVRFAIEGEKDLATLHNIEYRVGFYSVLVCHGY